MDWIVDCKECGRKTEETYINAVNDPCPVCGSWKTEVYKKSVAESFKKEFDEMLDKHTKED